MKILMKFCSDFLNNLQLLHNLIEHCINLISCLNTIRKTFYEYQFLYLQEFPQESQNLTVEQHNLENYTL